MALCEQQREVIVAAPPVSVGLISGALGPDQWKDSNLWRGVLSTHRITVTIPQVFLDALRHGYVIIGRDISLIIFEEAHHAVDNHRCVKEQPSFTLNNHRDVCQMWELASRKLTPVSLIAIHSTISDST